MRNHDIRRAQSSREVHSIVSSAISEVYPRYYPQGAVAFFLSLHCEENIGRAMEQEEIYLLEAGECKVGTGTIRGNEICRLFIRPEYQGQGYGSLLMDWLEERIFALHPCVHVDASFPAEAMYLKRGYRIASYEKLAVSNGDFLCYHTMEKLRVAAGKAEKDEGTIDRADGRGGDCASHT